MSGLSAVDPSVRILAAVLIAVTVVTLESLALLLVCLALAIGLVVAARLALGRTLVRLAALDLLILLSVLLLPFTTQGTEIARLGPLVASREGSVAALAILLKASVIITCLVSLVGTLDALELGRALGRLAVPAKLVALLFFVVRYIEVFSREQTRLRLAMKARAFTMRTDRHTWRATGYLVGMLLVRSFERAERVVQAMKCRGFTGTFPNGGRIALGRRDVAFAAGCCAVLAALVGMDRL